jgi:hypothetical protein
MRLTFETFVCLWRYLCIGWIFLDSKSARTTRTTPITGGLLMLEVPGTRSKGWRSSWGRAERKKAMRYLLVRIALFSGITIVSAVVLAVPYLTIQ